MYPFTEYILRGYDDVAENLSPYKKGRKAMNVVMRMRVLSLLKHPKAAAGALQLHRSARFSGVSQVEFKHCVET